MTQTKLVHFPKFSKINAILKIQQTSIFGKTFGVIFVLLPVCASIVANFLCAQTKASNVHWQTNQFVCGKLLLLF